MAPICDVHSISFGLVILEIIVCDTLMCRSRKLPALCPFMPFQGQSKTTLLALPIIPEEWWSHWPGISKQGQPTKGTFLRHHIYQWPLRPDRRSMMITQAWAVLVIQSHQGPVKPSIEPRGVCGCPRILGALPTVSWADHL